MAPERKHNSSPTFTIRLGIGSITLVALITFVGLAWIFFLGVMAGRMYYGVDTTVTQNASQGQQEVTTTAPVPSAMMPNEQVSTTTENVNPQKSNFTYHSVIKEDSMAERLAQGQKPFVGNEFESIQKINEPTIPAELGPKEKTEPKTGSSTYLIAKNPLATSETESITVLNSYNGEAITGDTTEPNLHQRADFIEKVRAEPSQEAAPTPIVAETKAEGTAHDELPSSSTISEQTADTPYQTTVTIDKAASSVEAKSMHTSQVKDDSTKKALLAQTQTNTNTEETAQNQTIFDYTYQLATFKNSESAHSITDKLIADGLNATALSE